MIAKHTPAPWVIEYDNADDRAGGQWFNVGGIATVPFRYSCTKHEEETARANARLIAAAPELLEALKDMIVLQAGISSDPVETLHKARAAIAKATNTD